MSRFYIASINQVLEVSKATTPTSVPILEFFRMECGNYLAISLLSVTGKVCTKVLQQRLKRYVEEEIMSEEQAGFRKGRGTMEKIFVIRQLSIDV